MRKNRLMNDSLGPYLKMLRSNLNKTLEQVKEETGISASYLNRIERGERKCVSAPVLEILARCYGRPPLEFMEIGLNQADEIESTLLFETIMYNNTFEFEGKIVSRKEKEEIIELLKRIYNAEWTSTSKWKDTSEIMESVEKLKRYIS